MRAKAWFWFLVMLVIPTSTGVRRWRKIGLGKYSGGGGWKGASSRVDLGRELHCG